MTTVVLEMNRLTMSDDAVQDAFATAREAVIVQCAQAMGVEYVRCTVEHLSAVQVKVPFERLEDVLDELVQHGIAGLDAKVSEFDLDEWLVDLCREYSRAVGSINGIDLWLWGSGRRTASSEVWDLDEE